MKNVLQVLLSLILIIGILLGVFLGLKHTVIYVTNSNSKLFASIVTASATILIGIIVTLLSHYKIKKREIEEAHRESKIELYRRYGKFLFDILSGMNSETTGDQPTRQEMVDFMVEFKRDMMFRSSPRVIKSMIDYEKGSTSKNVNEVFTVMHNLLLAMREDIGLTNKGLDNLELIQVMLKDKSEIEKI